MRIAILFVTLAGLAALPVRAEKLVLVVNGLKEPFGTAFAPDSDDVWIVEMVSGNRLLKLDAGGKLTHVAGRLEPGFAGDGGPGLSAQFNGPHNLAVLPDGNVLIGDTWNGRIRQVNIGTGQVHSVPGYEVPLEKARGSGPYCITLGFDGKSVYIANLRQILRLDLATDTTQVVAGNGQKGVPTDGSLAVEAPLVDPRAVAPDRQGNLYILERGGNALRVVDPQGRIRTVVNRSGKKGASGDGGPAIDATMNGPKHLCVDRDDSVLIADAENHLIRRYTPGDGTMQRIAGTGKKGSAGIGGPPTAAELARPHGVTVHPRTGELYITDSYNDRVLKIVK